MRSQRRLTPGAADGAAASEPEPLDRDGHSPMLTDDIRNETTAGKHGPALVAVLVHGTWAPQAPWTCEGSPFRGQLEKQLGVPVQFRRLPWSGVNSHMHRLEAAAVLRQLLEAEPD